MRAMILAAGFGTRLRPLTDRVPKPLIDVGGHPMITYPLAILREAGVREVLINLHHLGGQIREALSDGARYGLAIHYSEEDPILDTGGAIFAYDERNSEIVLWYACPVERLDAVAFENVVGAFLETAMAWSARLPGFLTAEEEHAPGDGETGGGKPGNANRLA